MQRSPDRKVIRKIQEIQISPQRNQELENQIQKNTSYLLIKEQQLTNDQEKQIKQSQLKQYRLNSQGKQYQTNNLQKKIDLQSQQLPNIDQHKQQNGYCNEEQNIDIFQIQRQQRFVSSPLKPNPKIQEQINLMREKNIKKIIIYQQEHAQKDQNTKQLIKLLSQKKLVEKDGNVNLAKISSPIKSSREFQPQLSSKLNSPQIKSNKEYQPLLPTKSNNQFQLELQNELTLTQTNLQTQKYCCFHCQIQIQSNFIQLKCFHFYHIECISEYIQNQIYSDQFNGVQCHCKKSIGQQFISQVCYHLLPILLAKQTAIIKRKYKKYLLTCSFCEFFCIYNLENSLDSFCPNCLIKISQRLVLENS